MVVGAGGHGRETLDIIAAVNAERPRFDVLGFLDDGLEEGSQVSPHGLSVLGGVGALRGLDADYVLAIGSPVMRKKIATQLDLTRAATVIHPRASIGSFVQHGPGLILGPGARITHAVEVGAHVHVNVNATVSHDSVIGDYVSLAPGVHLSGGVKIEEGVWMGIGSTAIQGVTVGAWTVVGAGAAVIADLPHHCTAVGVPAKPLSPGPS